MTFKTDYPQDDSGVTDFLESRQFYELMQKYRLQPLDALAEFEAVKSAIRAQLDSKQAEIDALILEYCPVEMTAEQILEWVARQRVDANEDKP